MANFINISDVNIKKIELIEKVSRETLEKLDSYISELFKWNEKINLVAKSEMRNVNFFDRHILDSIQLTKYIKREEFCDLGSGGGLPGIILSILTNSDNLLIESDKRKVAFLNNIKAKLNLAVNIKASRIENVVVEKEYILARAFSSIKNIFELLNEQNNLFGKKIILLKGVKVLDEIEEAKLKWSFDYKLFSSITNSESTIIKITDVNKK